MKRSPDLTGKRGVSAQVERMASQVSSRARPEPGLLFIFSQLLRVSAHTHQERLVQMDLWQNNKCRRRPLIIPLQVQHLGAGGAHSGPALGAGL